MTRVVWLNVYIDEVFATKEEASKDIARLYPDAYYIRLLSGVPEAFEVRTAFANREDSFDFNKAIAMLITTEERP